MPKNGKGGKGGADESEMAALEAITNALLQEVKANQDPRANGHIGSGSDSDTDGRKVDDDDNEPRLLRIVIYETSV